MTVLRACFAGVVVLFGLGCGDGGNRPTPTLVVGGGVTDAPLKDLLHVHVIDENTRLGIAGAYVQIGDTPLPALSGDTDANGLKSFDTGDLTSPTNITVFAAGYGTATWFDVTGANVTMTLRTKAAPPFAEFTGTIEGWPDVAPVPQAGHMTLAYIGYSSTGTIDEPQNDLEQPMIGMIAQNGCFRTAQLSPACSWTLRSRLGRVALYAVLLDVELDLQTMMPKSFVPLKFGISRGHSGVQGATVSNVSLRLTHDTLVNVTAPHPAAPSGLEETVTLPMLQLDGDEGQIPLIFSAGTMSAPAMKLPKLEGALMGMSYDITAAAQLRNRMLVDNAPKASGVFVRGVRDFNVSPVVPAFLPLPTGLGVTGQTFSWTLPPETLPARFIFGLRAANGEGWGGLILDPRRTSFTLPTLPAGKGGLPAGQMIEYRFLIGELSNFDRGEFTLDAVQEQVTRFSSDAINFNN